MLIVTTPYVLATALAVHLRRRGPYDVVAPNLGIGEAVPAIRWDAVVASVTAPPQASGVLIELPTSFEYPVLVTDCQKTIAVTVDSVKPIEAVLSLLDEHLAGKASPAEFTSPERR